jgi:hypothetical protein
MASEWALGICGAELRRGGGGGWKNWLCDGGGS